MAETFKAWQCRGCGRLEGPAQCVGICEDRPVELVNVAELDAALAMGARAEGRARALEEVVRRIALTTPRNGEWERTWRALQVQAKRALDDSPT